MDVGDRIHHFAKSRELLGKIMMPMDHSKHHNMTSLYRVLEVNFVLRSSTVMERPVRETPQPVTGMTKHEILANRLFLQSGAGDAGHFRNRVPKGSILGGRKAHQCAVG